MSHKNGAFQIFSGRNLASLVKNSIFLTVDNITFICFRYSLNSLLGIKYYKNIDVNLFIFCFSLSHVLESSHRMACAVQETGGKPVHSPVGPLPPRKKEALQPVDDDSGEKGLSPDLPSCAAGISRRLSYNQEEPQLGPEKVALEEQTVDRQDLGDR